MKKKYIISAVVLAALAMFNACQVVPSALNLAASVVFVAIAGACLVAANKTPETARK